jgi:predicted GNAT family acetyltransferase
MVQMVECLRMNGVVAPAVHEYGNATNATVVHNASKQRFDINIDDRLSLLEYAFKNHRHFLTHTEVPPALESQGWARS